MKNSIWQEFVLEKKTIGIFAAIAGGSWLEGILGMLIFQAFIKNDKALFPIATVLLVGIGSIFCFFFWQTPLPTSLIWRFPWEEQERVIFPLWPF